MEKKNHKTLKATLLLVVLLVGAVAALYRVPVASAFVADVNPGDPIPEETVPATEPEETKPSEEPTEPKPTTPPETEPQHQHSYNAVVTEPTCVEQGYTTHTCDCGDAFVDSYVPALGHDMRETAHVEPTVGCPGYIEYVCVRKDKTERVELPALPEKEEHMHDWVATCVAASCTADGYVHEECKSCGEVRRHDVTPAHGHAHAHAGHQDPQVGVEGWDKYVCSHCGDTYYVYIPALTPPPAEEEERESISGSWDMDF